MGVRICESCEASFVSTSRAKRCPSCRTADKRPSHYETTHAELAAIGKTTTALGATALGLAARLDRGTDAGSAIAAMAKELRAILAELTKAAPAVNDPVDEVRRRREERRREMRSRSS